MDISRSIAGNAAWARLLGKPASGQNERNEEWVTYPDGRRALLDTLKAPLRDPVTPLATSTCAPRWNHCGEPSGGAGELPGAGSAAPGIVPDSHAERPVHSLSA